MAEIVFTAEAVRDIEEIQAYIAQDSVRFANRQVQQFYIEAERLANFPRGGRMVPEIEMFSVREVIVGNYRMMYRLLEPDIVEVMIIHHAKRRFPYGRIKPGSIKRSGRK
ncbi:MAG: type II toxin-antitoxin system RelE/ParE family toxin [Flavobacteriales bacterium]|nr:type II toxin-antitoxin system RelE/ParE family toxin [Flavobacteriales bacterium]MBK9596891.1 type II toxin-antitoxin system RelE/ParE family toxin [Flavobacteriales bacterium]